MQGAHLHRASVFDAVVGQSAAIVQLEAALGRPVHAYLLHGPPGSGKRLAARSFGAALLCPDGGCGNCNSCRRALTGSHPDLIEVERSGASLSISDAQSVVARSQRRPLEGDCQILMIADLHLARDSIPVLLKSIEEPSAGTIFVLLADDLASVVDTVVSRCATVRFDRLSDRTVTDWLIGQGVECEQAARIGRSAGGRLDRARLLAQDSGLASRLAKWGSVPDRLDGTGAAAAAVAKELLEEVEAALLPLREEHARELERLAEQADLVGAKALPGRRQVEERHKREERRWRTDDLRIGLATLAESYRDRLVAASGPNRSRSAGGAADIRRALDSVEAIAVASRSLGRNANELLVMDALLVRLSGLLD
ncbi:MAG: DNA polymerase III subunit [Acidimicrobiales bacterium]